LPRIITRASAATRTPWTLPHGAKRRTAAIRPPGTGSPPPRP